MLAPMLGALGASSQRAVAGLRQAASRSAGFETIEAVAPGARSTVLRSKCTTRSQGVSIAVDGYVLVDAGARCLEGEAAARHLAECWQANGAAGFAALGGNFAAALVDPLRGTWLVRDAGGGKPLFVARQEGDAVFGSSALEVARCTRDGAVVDAAMLRGFLAHGLAPMHGRTLLRGVEPVPPGMAVRIDADEIVPLRVPPFGTGTLALAEAASRLRELLPRLLAPQAGPGVAVTLSGGLDSTSLLACLSLAQSRPRGFHFAHGHDALPAEFHERAFAEQAAARFDADLHFVDMPTHELSMRLERTCRAQDFPFGSPVVLAQARLFEVAAQHGAGVLLGGHGPDTLLGGGTSHLIARSADLLGRGRLLAAVRLLRGGRPYTTTPLARLGLATLAQALRPGAPSRLARETAVQIYDTVVPAALLSEECNARAAGLENRQPFLSREMLALAAQLAPDAMLPPNGETKAVLRRAFADRLPPAILARRRAVGFAVPALPWLEALPDWQERWDSLRTHAWFDGASGDVLAAALARRDAAAWGRSFVAWRGVILAEWLAAHAVRVA